MFPPSRLQDVISLIVKVERGKVTEVMHVARTRAHTGPVGRGRDVVHRSAARRRTTTVAASGALFRLDTAASGCGCGGRGNDPTTYLAQAFVPDVAPGAYLEIADGDEIVWRRDAPAEATAGRNDRRQGRPPRKRNGVVGFVGRRGRVLVAVVARRRDLAVGDDRADRAEGPDPGRSAAARRRSVAGRRPRRILLQLRRAGAGQPSPIRPPPRSSCIRWRVTPTPPARRFASGRRWSMPPAMRPTTRSGLSTGRKWPADLDAWVTLDAGERTVTLRSGKRGGTTSVSVIVTR